MRRKLPPLNALLAFEAAARHGNFTRAAEELRVAQPAITRHISNIENWLGIKLFTRQGNLVQLTREGAAVAELATAGFDRIELGLRNIIPPKNHDLVVGASFGVAHLWVMPRIGRMRAAASTNINVVTSDDYRSFDDATVHFSIRFGNGSFGINRADLLFDERSQIIASPSFLAANSGFDPDDLAGTIAPGLMLDHGDPNNVGWMNWHLWHQLADETFPGDHYLTEVQSYPTMLDMVRAGEGISIGTPGIESDLIAAGELVCVGHPVSRQGFGYYLVYREEMLSVPAFQKLRRFLMGSVRDNAPQSK